jgi:hypothetical protein
MGLPACRELKQQFLQPESLATTLGRARLALESNPPALVSLPIPGIEWGEGKSVEDADYTDRQTPSRIPLHRRQVTSGQKLPD